jgi:hypothetical protein
MRVYVLLRIYSTFAWKKFDCKSVNICCVGGLVALMRKSFIWQ